MFEEKKQNQPQPSPEDPLASSSPVGDDPSEKLMEQKSPLDLETPKESSGQPPVHSMPDKFLTEEKGKKGNKTLVIVIGIIVLLALILGVLYFLNMKTEKEGEIITLNEDEDIVEPQEFLSRAITLRQENRDEDRNLISSVTVVFPRGALETDMEITIDSEMLETEIDPNYKVVGGIFILEPKEINILEPVNMVFVFREGLIENDLKEHLKIGALVNDQWQELPSRPGVGNNIEVELNTLPSDIYGLIIPSDVIAERHLGLDEEFQEKYFFLSFALPSTTDSDRDGLTDEEEKMYGTDLLNPDTDEDSHLDGSEVINLYDPLGGLDIKLIDSNSVDVYTNNVFNYNIFYPTSFFVREVAGTDGEEVVFLTSTDEFIEILVQENPEKLSVSDWYLGQFSGSQLAEIQKVEVNDKELVVSSDGQIVMIGQDDKIYAIVYHSGANTSLNFQTTFQTMIKSFQLLEE